MVGRKLLHYEILEKLGEGGMGAVYKARDTHLDRFVAVKVLPPEAVANPERKRRFVQEAKAASALNHPNIIHIYDIGEADGVDFIAMEYVAGKTLEALIGRRGLPVSETLKYAIPIVEALAKAHAAGIVHRDLKPGNVMVNEDGVVKVLDFGLAKLTERVGESDPEGATETIPAMGSPRTEEGTLLGTVAYMSPEQAEGKPLDTRSDIFAFGVVLYEMLTGRRAFSGETKLSTLTSILHKEPTPPSQVAEGIPAELERIIGRCLRKSADRRFQGMADLRIALLDVKEESESGRASAPPPARRRVASAAVAAGIVVVALVVGITWWLVRPQAPPRQMAAPRPLTFDSGLTFFPAISRDGKLLAYASDRADGSNLDIWVQQMGGGQPVRLTSHPANDSAPDFSPDGTRIAFGSTRDGGGIYVIPALGGVERKIADKGNSPRFSPDGKWIAYQEGESGQGARIFVVASTGGQPRQIVAEFASALRPLWSPDGKYLLIGSFHPTQPPSVPAWDWWACPVDGGPPIRTGVYKPLTEQGVRITTAGAWEGGFFYLKGGGDGRGNVWRAPISDKTLQVAGPPERLTAGTGDENFPRVSAAGDLVFSALDSKLNLWSVPLDAEGKGAGSPQQLTRDAGDGQDIHLSPDGKKVAFSYGRSGNLDVWMHDVDTRNDTAIVATPNNDVPRKITADGAAVIYGTAENKRSMVYRVALDGGTPHKLCEDCYLYDVSSDDKKILTYIAPGPARGFALLELASGRKAELIKDSRHLLFDFTFSPDDRWIAFRANLGPERRRVFVIPVRSEGPPVEEKDWIPVTDGSGPDYSPRWSADGRLLYFNSQRDAHRCIWAQPLHAVTRQPVGEAFAVQHMHTPSRFIWFETRFAVARNRLVMRLADTRSNIWMVKVP